MADEATETSQTVAAGQLRAIVERIEHLEEEKATIVEDIGEVYKEAGSVGFDVPTIRKIIAMRRKDPAERTEAEALLDLYMAALGMVV